MAPVYLADFRFSHCVATEHGRAPSKLYTHCEAHGSGATGMPCKAARASVARPIPSPFPSPRVADPPLPPSRPGEEDARIFTRLSHLSVTDRCESFSKFGACQCVTPPPPAGGPARCLDRRSADRLVRKKAHSGAHSWHIRAHSGTFGHIRANLEIRGCDPDLQKPMFSRSAGRRGGTFAARTPSFL